MCVILLLSIVSESKDNEFCSFCLLRRNWVLFGKFRRRHSCDLLEEAAEMVGIVEAQQVRHFAHAQALV